MAFHAAAPSAAATDWRAIVALYDALLRAEPSPVVELNRAVSVAMRDGLLAGLALVDAILARGDLADYHLAHAARADLCRRLGRKADARAAHERALGLVRQEAERRFFERRIRELTRPRRPGRNKARKEEEGPCSRSGAQGRGAAPASTGSTAGTRSPSATTTIPRTWAFARCA